MKATSPAFLIALTCGSISALAQTPPDYGFTWRIVGDPGNAPALPSQRFPLLDGPVGSVSYEYRMAQTEVTNTQYLEFVLALTAAVPNTPLDGLEGQDLVRVPRSGGGYDWEIATGTENHGAAMGWSQAAMYCNWLTNNKRNDASAFLSGAYDVSTFWPNPGPPQLEHSPGARFWLPSRDEWVKAMFYDPNKLGPGQSGYWTFPISSDAPPITGLPGTPGAQTGAGTSDGDIPVGAYAGTQSPWGILDGSGGVAEWCEGYAGDNMRTFLGTNNFDPDPTSDDRLDQIRAGEFRSYPAGIRLVGIVPSPSAVVVLFSMFSCCFTRRRT